MESVNFHYRWTLCVGWKMNAVDTEIQHYIVGVIGSIVQWFGLSSLCSGLRHLYVVPTRDFLRETMKLHAKDHHSVGLKLSYHRQAEVSFLSDFQ